MHLETAFQAGKDGNQQMSTSLLVKIIGKTEGIDYVQSYMYVHVGLLQSVSRGMFEAAYQCAPQLAESEPVHQLAARACDRNMDDPEYKTLFDTLQPEILRIAMLEGNEAALAAAR